MTGASEVYMYGEKEADLAREQYSERLRKRGAHSIGTTLIRVGKQKRYAVEAEFAKEPPKLPPSLKIKKGRTEVEVPLRVRKGPMPTLE
jgi:hypothetical protein